MRLHLRFSKGFAELDHQIEKFRQLRNDYAEANRVRRHSYTILEPAPVSISAA